MEDRNFGEEEKGEKEMMERGRGRGSKEHLSLAFFHSYRRWGI